MRGECGRNVSPLCHPERSRGIYRSWYEAGQCEDSSTTLRFGRNDIVGEWAEWRIRLSSQAQSPQKRCHPTHQPRHPTRQPCHPDGSAQQPCHPDGSVHQPCHPDWSVSGMEGSIAVGTKRGSARIPPLRFASVGMTYGGIYRSWYDVGECEDSSTPLRFGGHDMRGGAVVMTDRSVILSAVPSNGVVPPTNRVIPTGASAEWRDLSQVVRCGGVRGFLHYASLRSE